MRVLVLASPTASVGGIQRYAAALELCVKPTGLWSPAHSAESKS